MFLLDTNVIGELGKGIKADPGVVNLLKANEDRLFLPVQVIGELRGGIEHLRRRRDVPQARRLENWFELVLETFADRILPFDLTCAQTWGRLISANDQNAVDKQIAAIALVYGLTVVTRNTDHFEGTGVSIINPFTDDLRPGSRPV